MSGGDMAPRCVNCGYIMAGVITGRCPECGHQARLLERWREGELHLEGPSVVLRVFVRLLGAASLMFAGTLGLVLLDTSMLDMLGLRVQVDPRWRTVPMAILAPIIAWLWTRPIRANGAHLHDLHPDAPWRAWLPALVSLWWIVAALWITDIFTGAGAPPNTAAPSTGTPPIDALRTAAHVLGIVGQVAWILVLLHVGRIGAYLRDSAPRRMAIAWLWIWLITIVIAPIAAKFLRMYPGRLSSPDLASVYAFSCLGFGVGLAMALRLLWITADALALAHELVARDARRAERERERYAAPD